jgi:hypothetical protein
MRPSILSVLPAAIFLGSLAFAPVPAVAQAAEPGSQSSVARGVTVKVMPRLTGADAANWVFAVVLDTHSQELSDDLLRTTVLVTDDGREIAPAAWTGAGPGSHHREGSLEFPAPNPMPKSFVLRMQRPGEQEARLFRFAP